MSCSLHPQWIHTSEDCPMCGTNRGNPLMKELLDLITLMPDSQTQKIIDYIMQLREIRKMRDDNQRTD